MRDTENDGHFWHQRDDDDKGTSRRTSSCAKSSFRKKKQQVRPPTTTRVRQLRSVRTMDTLLLEDEQAATLEEALAFIDTTYVGISSSDGGEGTTSEHSTDSENSLPTHWRFPLPHFHSKNRGASSYAKQHKAVEPQMYRQQQPQQPTLPKCREPNRNAVARHRKRAKDEILQLREQVLQLSARLAQIRKHGGTLPAPTRKVRSDSSFLQEDPATSTAQNHAVAELEKRQQSESLNRRLKDALKKYSKLTRRLDHVFERGTIKQDLELLLELEISSRQQSGIPYAPKVRSDARTFWELYLFLETVYLQTTMVTESISLQTTRCVFSSSNVYQDPTHGQVYEFTTNTSVSCTLRQLDKYLWSHISTLDFTQITGDAYSHMRGDPDHSSSEKKFRATFNCRFGEIPVDGVTAMRKFEEPGRLSLVFTSVLTPLGTGLVFRETWWVVISDVANTALDTSPPRALLMTCYRLHEEKSESVGASVACERTAYLREFLLQAQCAKMRALHLLIQNMLLQEPSFHEGSGRDFSRALVECPAR